MPYPDFNPVTKPEHYGLFSGDPPIGLFLFSLLEHGAATYMLLTIGSAGRSGAIIGINWIPIGRSRLDNSPGGVDRLVEGHQIVLCRKRGEIYC